MSYATGSINTRVFLLQKDMPNDIVERLKERPLPAVDTVKDQPVYGWCGGRYPMDRVLDEQSTTMGAMTRFSLGRLERKIPASLLRAEIAQEESIRLQASGNEYLSRKERTELKQEIVDRLLPTMVPAFKSIDVVYPGNGRYIYVSALSDNDVDIFVAYFRDAMGYAPTCLNAVCLASRSGDDYRDVRPVSFARNVDAASVMHDPGLDFLTWLWFQSETNPDSVPAQGNKVGVLVEGPVSMVMEGGGAHVMALRKGNPMVSAEATMGLQSGKKLSKATVSMGRGESVYKMAIDDTLAIRGFKPLASEGDLDQVSRFQDRVHQLQAVWEMIDSMFSAFLLQRKSPTWDKIVKEIRAWVAERRSCA